MKERLRKGGRTKRKWEAEEGRDVNKKVEAKKGWRL